MWHFFRKLASFLWHFAGLFYNIFIFNNLQNLRMKFHLHFRWRMVFKVGRAVLETPCGADFSIGGPVADIAVAKVLNGMGFQPDFLQARLAFLQFEAAEILEEPRDA